MAIGWIKMHRKLLEWEWYNDVPVRLTFMHLLLTANWEYTEYKKYPIQRGQCITGTSETPKKIGISKQQFRTAISKLKSTGEITTYSTNKFTVVTLVKYDDYQPNEEESTTKPTRNPTREQHQNNTQPNNTIRSKEDKEIKNIRNNLLSEINISDVEDSEKKYFQIAKSFQQLFIKNLEEKNSTTKDQRKATYKNYVDPIRLMFQRDEVNKDQVTMAYKFLNSPAGEFWKTNILSTKTLRKKISTLVAQANQPLNNKRHGSAEPTINRQSAQTIRQNSEGW
ncbi:hypothetical protein DSM03_10193 [Leeuwenhoekiella aestuarii]|uniref:Uncharacterized protein n=1 Tax=Leeuwenhoekiella aestuarii TaxID=2249426 RepID=A0A4Q0NTB7_9FLAO|nr:hypothetical protein [Leeuwenhoekiella aestuarii]RXG13980.1 hypothetical protein DSM04_10484 [Leeuwenhoekiella aestuarii]RXG18729.1 hypothetical protein DSM03_10193 [Leeuwenhoekiella aestuarii]